MLFNGTWLGNYGLRKRCVIGCTGHLGNGAVAGAVVITGCGIVFAIGGGCLGNGGGTGSLDGRFGRLGCLFGWLFGCWFGFRFGFRFGFAFG